MNTSNSTKTRTPISIVVADDHPIFRRGLVEMINQHSQYTVVAEVGDGEAAIQKIMKLHPDIAILDISMPVMDGLDVLAKGMSWATPPTFIILTMYDDKAYLDKAIEYGTKGYLLKDNAEEEVIICLDMISQGKHYITPAVAHHQIKPKTNELDTLSSMEKKVLMMVSDYKTNAEIAGLLAVSIRTIENHRAHICKKLALHGHHALTRYVAKRKLEQ